MANRSPPLYVLAMFRPDIAAHHRALWTVAMLTALGVPLHAQCPDGAPPPCRRAVPAVVRRPNPALDARAWIVVPFGNVTKAPDLDWLRDASVNLLSLDLSRWTDIRVVDDKRVADLVRELPPSSSLKALSLSDGLALARRAGAGRLVMGDFVKLGRGTRLLADVFDVKSGARLRSASSQAVDADSLLSAFGPLARGVLDVPPPPDAKLGSLGTTRMDAYQEYLLGVAALNRLEIISAQSHLKRAIELDSTFALAHWKLADAYDWGGNDRAVYDSLKRFHSAAAMQWGASLPARPRALMAARAAIAAGDAERACELVAPLVARDSSDVEALYTLGECSFQGNVVVPSDTNPGIGRFKTSWNTAYAAFHRVLLLDPRFHAAYVWFLGPSQQYGHRHGCLVPTPGVFCSTWIAVLRPSGDSLIEIPVDVARNPAAYAAQQEQAARERARTVMFREVKRMMQAWDDAAPREPRAHYQLGRILNDLGETVAADAQLRQVDSSLDPDLFVAYPQWRTDLAIKMGRAAEARAWFDSIVARSPDRPGTAWRRGSWMAVFGKSTRFRAWVDQGANRSVQERTYIKRLPALMLGATDDSIGAVEAEWFGAPASPSCGHTCADMRILPSLAFGLRRPRAAWPALSDSSDDPRLLPAKAVIARDTAALRRAAGKLEADVLAQIAAGDDDRTGAGITAIDAFVMLGDSARALRLARVWVDSSMARSILFASIGNDWPAAPVLWPRGMLQRADLAAALGYKEEARSWYARLLDLWSEADPEMQPTVNRIRAALAKLGPSG